MTDRGQRKGRAGRSRVQSARRARARKILVFGEDENDTKVIAELIRAICPGLTWSIETFRRPPVLVRDARPEQVPERVAQISALIDAAAVDAEVLAVFAHEDCDAVEPAHIAVTQKIEAAFRAQGYTVQGVAPAWEMETWLFLWPDAVAAHRRKWAALARYRGRNVGLIVNAKEELVRALRPSGEAGRGVRDYRESDAPQIAALAAQAGLVPAPAAVSASFDDFHGKVEAVCGGVAQTS